MAPLIALALVWATGGCALRGHSSNIGDLIASATAQGGAAPQSSPTPQAPAWSVPVAINLPPAPAGFAAVQAGPADYAPADYANDAAGTAENPPAVGTPPVWNPTQPSPPYRLPPEFAQAEPAAMVAVGPASRPVPTAVAQLPIPAPAATEASAPQDPVTAVEAPATTRMAIAEPAPEAPGIKADAPDIKPIDTASAPIILAPHTAETAMTGPIAPAPRMTETAMTAPIAAAAKPRVAQQTETARALPATRSSATATPRTKAATNHRVTTTKRAARNQQKVAGTKAKKTATKRSAAKTQRQSRPATTAKARSRNAKPAAVVAKNKRDDRKLVKPDNPRERGEADASPTIDARPGHQHPAPIPASTPSGFVGPMAPDSTTPIGVTHSSSLERRGPPPPARLALDSPALRIQLPGAAHRTRPNTAAHARHGVDEMRIAFVLSHDSVSEDHAL